MGLNIKKIELLPLWCVTDKYPSFYDTESATAIEQTAKLYGAMRTLQEEYNNMATNVNTTITAFITDVNADQEEFENHINKIVHDYIIMLDEKIKMQDSVIAEAVQYMKDNLISSIKDLNKNNELDNMIVKAISNVENELLNKQSIYEDKTNAKIQSLASGNPFVANSVSDMTDPSKIYVNTTDGNWYYYSGSEWVSGGIYQSTEIADGSITKEKTDFLKVGKNLFNPDMVSNGFVSYMNGNISDNTSYRTSEYIKIKGNTLHTIYSGESQLQMAFYDLNKIFISGIMINKEESFTTPETAVYLRFSINKSHLLNTQLEEGEKTDYENFCLKIRNLKVDNFNIPKDNITPEKISFCETTKNLFNNKTITKGMFVASTNGNLSENASHYASDYIKVEPNKKMILHKVPSFQIAFYNINRIYIGGINYTNHNEESFTTPINCSYLRFSTSNSGLDEQMLEYGETKSGYEEFGIYLRDIVQDEGKNVFVGSTRKFKTLKEGIEFATQSQNAKVFVDPGEYDLYNEFGGQEFFDNYSAIADGKGIVLKNGIHIIFSSGAKVIFNYNGSNADVHREFSPFNSGYGGFVLENATIECSNCRYCVHDERGETNDAYINKYLNCNMKIDNSQNPNWTANQSIGGGLGHDGQIVIDSCIFATAVSYHNNNSNTDTTAKSSIVIKNNYFKDGRVVISHCGKSTNKSLVLIANNSAKYEPIVRFERPEIDFIENMEVYQINNEIRPT